MKILQINVVYKDKSTGRNCYEVGAYFNSHGDECYTVYGIGRKSDSEYAYKFESKFEYNVHNFLSRFTGLEGYFSHLGTVKLINFIKRIKPDVVHLHNLHGHYLNLQMLFKYLAKMQIPVVINLHDCWIFTGKCTYPTRTGCDKWQTACKDCPAKKEYPTSWFFDRSKKMFSDKKRWLTGLNVKAVIGVSDWVTDLGKLSFLNKFDVRRIYNWINLDVFKPYSKEDTLSVIQKYNIQSEKFTIICVAAAWSENSTKNNELNEFALKTAEKYQIIVVGKNSESIKGKNVVSIEFISDIKELALLYSCADVYLHLSVADTFGKVIAEAMACGTPAVVYDVSACAELVTADCGKKVTPHDVDGLIKFVGEIEKSGKNHYSDNCVKRVNENFNYNNIMSSLVEVYHSCLDVEK